MESIERGAFEGCDGLAGVVTIEKGLCGDNMKWELDNEGTLTIRGEGEMSDWYSWSMPWYGSRETIKKVVIEEGVTSVGAYAFYECENLSELEIAESVTKIGEWAFYGCVSLTNIRIPESVESIERGAFEGCSRMV